MRVLIVENEIYLAQSISNKIGGLGYECEIVPRVEDALNYKNINIVLLSTSINESMIYKIISHFKDAIIILLVTYISNDTVSKPIKAGADDFIQKPFMIEELIRKIRHFEEFNKYKQLNETYSAYIQNYFSTKIPKKQDFKKLTLPLFIHTNNIDYADSYVFFMSKYFDFAYKYIQLNNNFNVDKFIQEPISTITYLSNLGLLKDANKKKLLDFAKGNRVIISSTGNKDECEFETIELNIQEKTMLTSDRILPVDEYVKQVISNYQEVFSDTELAKRLGMSRKSLWEKRKKYGIIKKK